ncbi:MAG: phosphoenolpyruvate--protein phosphotransferase [Defluviitaleaceae bacterium]|nr:phosphoenolpyruvate--protein phosphotransferase [Defluviitaleaceae bacterium]
MANFNGIAASEGIAVAKVFKLEEPNLTVKSDQVTDVEAEIIQFEAAIKKTVAELEKIKEKAKMSLGEANALIFDAHINMVTDPELKGQTIEKIRTDSMNAAFAFDGVANQFIAMFEGMDNAYFRERAADIKDVKKRLLSHLLGVALNDPSLIDEAVIVVAHDLTPSDTAGLNRQFVKGFVTNIGGRTSHSAIMARSLEIPAIVGMGAILEEATDGEQVILDGLTGTVILNPTVEQIKLYEEKRVDFEAMKKALQQLKDQPTMTCDGQQVELVANVGTPEDAKGAVAHGAEGIGLYRTEFLYMDRSELPTEEEQFVAYKAVLEAMQGKPVVVRTLDIGGDKALPYLQLPHEINPFLGYRAIRVCLDRQPLFNTQLRALLRASVYGKLCVMFPMIATLDEFKAAKQALLEAKAELLAEGVPVADDIQIGMMVEIPSAAIFADQFAKEVDFFSIGTNDLIQYAMAADRMSEKVAYLYQPYHPSILRLIKMVIDAAHQAGKWTGMCGEMAGDALAIPLLLGLGLDEFSMSATSILAARKQISHLSKKEMANLANEALNMQTMEEVVALVKNTATTF